MSFLYLANTDFEFEFTHPMALSLLEGWTKYPFCLQLQFLPLLYASSQDAVAVSSLPEASFLKELALIFGMERSQLPRLELLSSPQSNQYSRCISWGWSERVKKWAESNGIPYNMPPIEVVKEINSKAFSFINSPKLPEAALLSNLTELEAWIKNVKGKKVLKTCFGLAGKGHRFIDDSSLPESIRLFCEKEWNHNRPLLGEIWVDRVFDFSTQWLIKPQKQIELLGSTVFEVDQRGQYLATLAGDEEKIFSKFLPFLAEHKKFATALLKQVQERGFYGHIGVDAFIYKDQKGNLVLHPIVELNGRQTMSFVALKIYQRYFPNQVVRLTFTSKTSNGMRLLPQQIQHQKFDKNLFLEKI